MYVWPHSRNAHTHIHTKRSPLYHMVYNVELAPPPSASGYPPLPRLVPTQKNPAVMRQMHSLSGYECERVAC